MIDAVQFEDGQYKKVKIEPAELTLTPGPAKIKKEKKKRKRE